MRRARQAHSLRALAAGLLVTLVFPAGCGATDTNTNWNWLRVCDHSEDCTGELDCLCGICTKECSLTADCREAGEGVICANPSSCSLPLAICTDAEGTTSQAGSSGSGASGDSTAGSSENGSEAGTFSSRGSSGEGGGADGSAQGAGVGGGAATGAATASSGSGGAPNGGGGTGAASGELGGAASGGVPPAGGAVASGGTAGTAGTVIGSAGSAGVAGGGTEPTNPVIGSWHEEARYDCATGAELPAEPAPINEIVFEERSFSVTWTPFESYQDYEGTYVVDLDAGTIEMTIMPTSSNYVPPDTDLSGSFQIDSEGRVVLQDIWFGIDQAETAEPACGHRLARN